MVGIMRHDRHGNKAGSNQISYFFHGVICGLMVTGQAPYIPENALNRCNLQLYSNFCILLYGYKRKIKVRMANERDAGIPSPAQQPGTHAPWRESPTQQQNRLQHVACRRFEVKGNTG